MSKAMTDELVEEIANDFLDFEGLEIPEDAIPIICRAMRAYHEAKLKEVTDADIKAWANSKEKIIDEMPETLKLHITKKIECRIDGAKAMRDGEIKHIEP